MVATLSPSGTVSRYSVFGFLYYTQTRSSRENIKNFLFKSEQVWEIYSSLAWPVIFSNDIFCQVLLLSCFNIAPQYLKIFSTPTCEAVLPSRYNIEFSRRSDTSSLKFILKLLMFDHSLRHFVLKFAELKDLQQAGQEIAGQSLTCQHQHGVRWYMAAKAENIKKLIFPDGDLWSDRGY